MRRLITNIAMLITLALLIPSVSNAEGNEQRCAVGTYLINFPTGFPPGLLAANFSIHYGGTYSTGSSFEIGQGPDPTAGSIFRLGIAVFGIWDTDADKSTIRMAHTTVVRNPNVSALTPGAYSRAKFTGTATFSDECQSIHIVGSVKLYNVEDTQLLSPIANGSSLDAVGHRLNF